MQTTAVWSAKQAKHRATAAPTSGVIDRVCAAGATPTQLLLLSKATLKAGVLDVTIPLAVYNTACTSNAGMPGDQFIPTTKVSAKVFTVATGYNTLGSTVAKLHHPVCEPA